MVRRRDSRTAYEPGLSESKSTPAYGCVLRGLTFDMRGGRQLAKPDVARPLDGRVRHGCRGQCKKMNSEPKARECTATRRGSEWSTRIRRPPAQRDGRPAQSVGGAVCAQPIASAQRWQF